MGIQTFYEAVKLAIRVKFCSTPTKQPQPVFGIGQLVFTHISRQLGIQTVGRVLSLYLAFLFDWAQIEMAPSLRRTVEGVIINAS